MNDDYNNLSIEKVWAPVAVAADKLSDAIDLLGYKRATIVLSVGVVTDGAYAMELQECATSDGTFTAVADADLIGTEPTGIDSTHDEVVHKLGYRGNKRYLKVSVTETTAGTTGGIMGVNVIKGGPLHAPVA